MTNLKIQYKETHVFIKDENSFTAIGKKPNAKGNYQVFTTKPLKASNADDLERLNDEITVKEINIEKGFIFIRLKKGFNYNSIVSAIKTALYAQDTLPR
jgi:hypothetical protein